MYEKQLITSYFVSLSKSEQQLFLQNTFEKYVEILGKVSSPMYNFFIIWEDYICGEMKQFTECTENTSLKLNL